MRSFTPEHNKASESTEATDITPIRYSPRGKILTPWLWFKKRETVFHWGFTMLNAQKNDVGGNEWHHEDVSTTSPSRNLNYFSPNAALFGGMAGRSISHTVTNPYHWYQWYRPYRPKWRVYYTIPNLTILYWLHRCVSIYSVFRTP